MEGEGSLLLLHGLMTPIAVDHSRNISVRILLGRGHTWGRPRAVEAHTHEQSYRLCLQIRAPSLSRGRWPHSGGCRAQTARGVAVEHPSTGTRAVAVPAPAARSTRGNRGVGMFLMTVSSQLTQPAPVLSAAV